jgi:hypothetical protein
VQLQLLQERAQQLAPMQAAVGVVKDVVAIVEPGLVTAAAAATLFVHPCGIELFVRQGRVQRQRGRRQPCTTHVFALSGHARQL